MCFTFGLMETPIPKPRFTLTYLGQSRYDEKDLFKEMFHGARYFDRLLIVGPIFFCYNGKRL
jgi:hypothetical protein